MIAAEVGMPQDSVSSARSVTPRHLGAGRRRAGRAGRGFALLAFVVVFPGFFAYHALVAEGMPAFLRGYSVLAAALATPIVALGYLQAMGTRHSVVWVDAVFLAFVMLLAGAAAIGAASGADAAIVSAHLGTVPQWMALYGVARLLDPTDHDVRRALTLSWLTMSAIVLGNLSKGAFLVAALEVPDGGRDTLATYQDFALLYLIVSVLCIAAVHTTWRRAVVFIVATVVLFLTGARSEFIALLLAALLISWCLTRQRLALAAGISALVIAAALAISAMLAAGALADLLPDNRVMDLIENRAEGSLSDRSEMLADAWKTLGEHPLLGHYASYKPGEYAHNILSAWIDLGIVGLTLLLLLLVLPLVDLGRQFAKRQRDVGFVGTITLLLLALLLLLAAKAFTYNLIPFALGAYAFDRTRRAARRPQ
jgi:hypothetical protein